LLFQISYGQNDDLLKKWKNASLHDTMRLMSLYDFIWEKIYVNLDTAQILAQEGLNSPLTSKHPQFNPKFNNALGAISQLNGNFVKAIEYYQEGLRTSEKIKDLKAQSIMLGNIGSIYIQLGDHKLALKYQKHCLDVLTKLDDEPAQASVYNNLSIIYSHLSNPDLALEYAFKSKNIYEKYNDTKGLIYCLANLGNVYEKMRKPEDALTNYRLALKYAEENENLAEVGKLYNEIGGLLFALHKGQEAKLNYDKALKILQEIDDLEGLKETTSHLHDYYKSVGNYKEALKYYEKHFSIIETMAMEETAKEINKRAVEFEYAKKAAADSVRMADERLVNQEKIKAKNAEIDKANTQKMAFVTIAFILLVVAFIIYNRFRLIQQQKLIIEQKNKQTEEQKLIIEEKQKEILDSINYAKRIQDSLLDIQENISRFFNEAFILNKPKDIVSGDFYWMSKKINTKSRANSKNSEVIELFFIAVCDSTGHGVPGGFMSLLNMAYLSEAINEKSIYDPNKIFDYVRDRLINTISKHEQKDGFDGVLLRFEKKQSFENKELKNTSFKLDYAAAYNAPIIIRNGKLMELESDNMPVGYGERTQSFKLFSIDLEKNDVVYVYTDGYADQFGGPKGKKFMSKQLNKKLFEIYQKPLKDQAEELENQFERWKGDLEQVDDVCVIGLKPN